MFLSHAAISYSWSQLLHRRTARRFGIDLTEEFVEIFGVKLLYCSADEIAHASASKPYVVVIRCRDTAWQEILTRDDNGLSSLSITQLAPEGVTLPLVEPVPVLFWGAGYEDGSKPFVERREDGTVIFYADILAATFFMLSRWEETVSGVRDLHGRFPADASVAYKQGFLDRPLVDEYALILQAWLQTLLPTWQPVRPSFSIKLSHDIDYVGQFSGFSEACRVIGGDLLKRHSVVLASGNVAALLKQTVSPARDPYLQGIKELATLSEENSLVSAFYFKSSMQGPYDTGYDPASPLVSRCIEELKARGHEIGFHPGYDTLDDPERFMAEKQRLDQILGDQGYGGRQHYLRFRAPDTWRQWEQAGLLYDSSVGYADHEGFRCGSCHPFQPFDVQQDRQLDLLEVPLIAMDATFRHYRGFTPAESEAKIIALAQSCQRVHGVFTLLWHNSSLSGEWQPWADMYRRILPYLARLKDREI